MNFIIKNKAALNKLLKLTQVSLATQTLSSSVAKALITLKELNCEEFQNVDGTVEYISVNNELFDILNSRHPNGRLDKQPINKKNYNEIVKKLNKFKEYYLNLKMSNGKPLYLSNKYFKH